MRVSVVVTVKNEEASIGQLLDSLISQTKKPDEIVVVDGGSTDQTVYCIESFQLKHKSIRLIKSRGNIAHGRNVAIRKAKHDIIAQIDAGCIAKRNWLKKVTSPLRTIEVEFVAGFYEMVAKTSFEKAIALFLGVPKERFDPRCFMPSARSMAFRKYVWKKIGGYNEKLQKAGEDTLFNYNLLTADIAIDRQKEAIVYWRVPSNLLEACRKFYTYAMGDAQAGIWWHPAQKLSTHNLKISLIWARYLIGLILFTGGLVEPLLMYFVITGFCFYLIWSIWKFRDISKDLPTTLWIPVIQVASDLAVMAGFANGTIRR